MIWTKKQHYPKLDGYDTVLGFNEPNHKDQANMSPESAAYHWMRFITSSHHFFNPSLNDSS